MCDFGHVTLWVPVFLTGIENRGNSSSQDWHKWQPNDQYLKGKTGAGGTAWSWAKEKKVGTAIIA